MFFLVRQESHQFSKDKQRIETTGNGDAPLPAVLPPTTRPLQLTFLVVAGPIPSVVSSEIMPDSFERTGKGTLSLPN